MLDAHGAYVDALLRRIRDPRRIDLDGSSQTPHRRAARALERRGGVERMLAEPASRAALPPRVAVGLLAALRRHALGALALHAGLERGVDDPVRGMAPLAG